MAGPSRRPPTSPSRSACCRCWATAFPRSLKVLLLAIAIFDDLGAILIIALFYTSDLSQIALLLAILPVIGLARRSICGVSPRSRPMSLLGIVLWVLVLKSGIHATLAGVATALAIPLAKPEYSDHSVLRRA